ncbi:MAG: radical SAM family RiPP maturation amino acid epimerase [Lachnospiraceae bacterium]|nr:radical SAM family RiPP maturation amino acid epimerase [Lachnospiraceae bacterium]
MRERFFDEKDRNAIGNVKRFLEYENMIPGFLEEAAADPQAVIDKYGFPLTPEDVSFLPMDPARPRHLEARYPDSKGGIYAGFVNRKLEHVQMLVRECAPKEPRFARWREEQMGRCMLDLGPQYSSIIHVPVVFELAKGCSVGCEFCGLNAGPLRSLFRYTDENAMLWKDILQRLNDLIGPAAAEATLYFATEPLDNPDYELFMRDFRDILGNLPQITTAVSARNIERLRPLIKELNDDGRFIYRFSVLSEEMYHELCRAFTAEELALVELLPQYEQAPGNHFAVTGRCDDTKDEIPAGGTISCVTGFIINMCEKTVTLSTPTWADAAHSEGQIVYGKETFKDGADLQVRMERMISEKMKVYIEPDDILCTYPYLKYVKDEGSVRIESEHGTAFVLEVNDDVNIVEKVFELVSEGCYTRREIVTKIIKSSEYPAVQSQYLFYLINRFWSKGIFVEKGGLHGKEV